MMTQEMNNKPTSRKQELFQACTPDDWYIFKHEEDVYDWDEIVNAFIAGGLYADRNPLNPWRRFDKCGVWMETVDDSDMCEVCNVENGEISHRSGNDLVHELILNPDKWTHWRLFEYPYS